MMEIEVWDHDIVENHNIPNQAFSASHCGMPKVEAITQIIERSGFDCKVIPHFAKFSNPVQRGITFVCVDSMSARQEIWKAMRYGMASLLIDTRIDAESGRIYTIDPVLPDNIEIYEKSLYSDSEAVDSPCTYHSCFTTANVCANIAVHQLIRYARQEEVEPELIFSLKPMLIFCNGLKEEDEEIKNDTDV